MGSVKVDCFTWASPPMGSLYCMTGWELPAERSKRLMCPSHRPHERKCAVRHLPVSYVWHGALLGKSSRKGCVYFISLLPSGDSDMCPMQPSSTSPGENDVDPKDFMTIQSCCCPFQVCLSPVNKPTWALLVGNIMSHYLALFRFNNMLVGPEFEQNM